MNECNICYLTKFVLVPDLFFSVFLIEEALSVEWAKTTMGRM